MQSTFSASVLTNQTYFSVISLPYALLWKLLEELARAKSCPGRKEENQPENSSSPPGCTAVWDTAVPSLSLAFFKGRQVGDKVWAEPRLPQELNVPFGAAGRHREV